MYTIRPCTSLQCHFIPHQTCIMTMITLLYSCWFSVGYQTYIMTVIASFTGSDQQCWALHLHHDCDHILMLVQTSSVGHQTCTMTVMTLLYSCWFSVGTTPCIMTVITSSCWLRRAMLAPDLRHDSDHILMLVPTSSVGHQTCIMSMITLLYSCWLSVGHQACIMTVITLLYSCWFSVGHQTCTSSVGHQTCIVQQKLS